MATLKQRSSVDLLGAVSAACVAAFIGILCFVASADPATRQLLSLVVTGLGAGGLILYRQLRKATNSLITSEARAQYAATHDPLTQLPNKALLLDRLKGLTPGAEQARRATSLGVLCIGLDRYDEIGEVLGPDVCDALILEIAARLGSACLPGDVLARLGDDVFALIVSSQARATAPEAAAHLIGLLSAPYRASSGQAIVTCSIGASGAMAGATNPVELLRQAQIALSSARKRGAAQFGAFEASMDHALKIRKAMEVELRRALADGAQADGALAMAYQPQVTAKGAMVGVEALMRWTSAERGSISASTFVSLAETCGLSDALGAFALRQAFIDGANWSGLKVAINVSGAQIRSGLLVGTLRTLLAETGANPGGFELEITEGVLLADEPETHETLQAVRKMGFALSLDDFGTGYSSLGYLRRFPVNKIKIDRSFISQLGKRPESSAIIQAIVDMADALDLQVLAEGVENLDQVQRLMQMGCVAFQGYYYSEPVDARMIADLLAGRSKLAA
ncbi:MAG TPA: EAL domain-containing protein [Caulobacteraceae bacterium]|nr:EAL domain-containing protein [Caulobacteraceae bacterium]